MHLDVCDCFKWKFGASVAQVGKRWPAYLAVSSSSPARGEIFSTVKGFHCTQPLIIVSHRPDRTAILLERT